MYWKYGGLICIGIQRRHPLRLRPPPSPSCARQVPLPPLLLHNNVPHPHSPSPAHHKLPPRAPTKHIAESAPPPGLLRRPGPLRESPTSTPTRPQDRPRRTHRLRQRDRPLQPRRRPHGAFAQRLLSRPANLFRRRARQFRRLRGRRRMGLRQPTPGALYHQSRRRVGEILGRLVAK